MKRWISLVVIVMLLSTALLGCGQDPASNSEQETDKKIKVALLLSGPVNDMGWNASAYEGLKEAEERFGVETAYQESIQQSDIEGVFRGYAEAGYDVIIGHGFQFGDTAMKVATEYPDSKFVVTSSNITQEPNLGSVNLDNVQQGFLMGAVAGLITESNVVAGIGGQDIPPIKGSVIGFEEGVRHVNPDANILTTMTGTNDDVAKTKETALAMISQGADVVMANANQAGLGAIEAAKTEGIYAIGSNQDQNDIAPDTVVVSGIKSVPVLVTFVVEKVLNDEFEAKFYNLGINEGAVYLSSFHGFEDKLSQEVKEQIKAIEGGLASGEIKVSEY